MCEGIISSHCRVAGAFGPAPRSILPVLLFAVVLFPATSVPARAQTATVAGGVVDAATGDPLPGATIFAVGTVQGTASAADGTYRLLLRPGTYTLRVTYVGYSPAAQQVNVQPGQALTVDFRLSPTTLQFDEILVSGSGMPTEAKRLGSTAARIDAAQVVELAPVTTLTELLQSRAPGVVTLLSSGEQGAAASLRLRGFDSVTLSQEPILYVNGIRIDNGGGWGGFDTGGGQAPSHLNDINPDDIETVEILRGAAATTLYGSEASAGVIHLTTKRSLQGPPRLTFQAEQGAVVLPDRFEANYNYVPGVEKLNARVARAWLGLPRTVPDAEAAAYWPALAQELAGDRALTAAEVFYGYTGPGDRILTSNPRSDLIEPGYHQAYLGSVSGGNAGMSYYFSGKFDRASGSLGPPEVNVLRRVNLHASFSADVLRQLALQVNSNLVHSKLRMPNAGWDRVNYMIGASFANPLMAVPEGQEAHEDFVRIRAAGRNGELFVPLEDVAGVESTQDKVRFFGNARLTYTPGARLRNELNFGVDQIEEENIQFSPYGQVSWWPAGRRVNFRRTTTSFTMDDRATLHHDLGEHLSLLSMAGLQAVLHRISSVDAWGTGFLGPGLSTIGNTEEQGAYEYRQETVQVGLFVQEQLGFRDHLFVTLGGRVDRHSAFGDRYGAQLYPSASVSYVPTDAAYWPLVDHSLLGTLRLRAAYGRSGLVPGPFEHLQTYGRPLPGAPISVPGLVPTSPGNPELEPAVTAETEFGLDARLLGDRLGLSLTRYHARTENDLIRVPVAPSLGFTNAQLRNLGEVVSYGYEAAVDVLVLQARRTSLRLNAFIGTNESEVRRLGSQSPSVHRVGYPVSAIFAPVLDPDNPYDVELDGDGIPDQDGDFLLLEDIGEVRLNRLKTNGAGSADSLVYVGDPNPGLTGALSMELRLFDNLRVYALLDWMTGYQIGNGTEQDRFTYFFWSRPWLHLGQSRRQAEIQQELYDERTTVARKRELADELTRLGGYHAPANYVEDAGFARLREVSVIYALPPRFTRKLGVRALSLTFAARNVLILTRYSGPDPEVNWNGRHSFKIGSDYMTTPQVRRFTTTLSMGF